MKLKIPRVAGFFDMNKLEINLANDGDANRQ